MHRYKAKVHVKNSMNGIKLDQTQIFTIEAENKSQAKEIIYKRYAYIPRQNISVVVHKNF